MAGDRLLDPDTLGDHIDRLYRAAWALCGTREDAEDLVQETFAQVLKRPRLLRAEDDLGYLLRALRNVFISQRRAAKRRPAVDASADALTKLEDHSTARPEQRLRARELYAAIAALPDIFRDALVAVDLVGLSYTEAARALGIGEPTLTTRLHRARQRLARALSDEGERSRTPRAGGHSGEPVAGGCSGEPVASQRLRESLDGELSGRSSTRSQARAAARR